jgi:hypothetical protein
MDSGVASLLMLWYAGRVVLISFSGGRGSLCRLCDSVARGWSRAVLKRVGEPISVEGMELADRDRLCENVRHAVARLRGGEGRTSCLPGEPPLDDLLGPSKSNSNPP